MFDHGLAKSGRLFFGSAAQDWISIHNIGIGVRVCDGVYPVSEVNQVQLEYIVIALWRAAFSDNDSSNLTES